MNSMACADVMQKVYGSHVTKTEPQDVVCGEMSRSGPILPSWGSKLVWPEDFVRGIQEPTLAHLQSFAIAASTPSTVVAIDRMVCLAESPDGAMAEAARYCLAMHYTGEDGLEADSVPSRWCEVFGEAEVRNSVVNPVMITLPDGCPVRCDPGDSLAVKSLKELVSIKSLIDLAMAESRTLVRAGQGYTEETKPRLVLSVCPAPKPAFPPRVLGRDWTIAALLPPDAE